MQIKGLFFIKSKRPWGGSLGLEWKAKSRLSVRLQDSRIFSKRYTSDGPYSKRKVWSKCKNGEARALHTRGSRLRHFAPSENIRKRQFCSLTVGGLCFSPCLVLKSGAEVVRDWKRNKMKSSFFPHQVSECCFIFCRSCGHQYLRPSLSQNLKNIVFTPWRYPS